MYERLLRPFLLRVDAEKIHDQTLTALSWAQQNAAGRAVLRLLAGPLPRTPVNLWGLTFPNVLGMAAGFDKDVRVATGLGLLGFGHVEVGTLTPRPQPGNPRPRIFRLPADEALINRMGFPNGG
jgi:dihydroorotate dehydrogenase